MCELLGHIVRLIASVRRRQHGDRDDASRRHQDVVPASGPRPSQETVGSFVIGRPESSSSNRGTSADPATSCVRSDNAPSRSLADSGISGGAHQRADLERQTRKSSTTSLTKSQPSMYPREGEETGTIDEISRPPKEEGQHPRDEDSADDKRDTSRRMRHSSLKESADTHRSLAPAKDARPIIPPSASLQHLFEAQSRELSILQYEHRATLEEKKALTDAYAALKQQYDERSKKLSVARHERRAALEQRKEIDDAYNALKQQYDEQVKKLNAVRHERLAVLEQKQKAEEECAALKQSYEAQQGEYNALSNKYQSLKAVLEQRTSELQGAQRFLTITDTSSGSEVVNTLRKLNEEVHQSIATMAEWAVESFIFDSPPQSDQTTPPGIEQTRTLETLGMRFMQLLGTKQHKDNPTLVEMALRAYLIYELYWVASPWSIGQEEQSHNLYVDAIYQRIREAEGSAVSGNWRALTRAHTLPACIGDPEIAHTFDTTIVSGFSDVLSAAGCTATKSDITSTLWSKFGEEVHRFVSLAGQVNKIIGMGVISEDFEVLVIWPDVVFDDRAMEDAYDNGDRAGGTEGREEIVLCATQLGLMQRMQVGGSSRHKGKSSEFIVIKPKIALVSMIDPTE